MPYSSAKAGVIGLTKALAKEVATRGILVNAVALGRDRTAASCSRWSGAPSRPLDLEDTPWDGSGRPEEVAALVAWLASDECSFSTGAVYDLSGGRATY